MFPSEISPGQTSLVSTRGKKESRVRNPLPVLLLVICRPSYPTQAAPNPLYPGNRSFKSQSLEREARQIDAQGFARWGLARRIDTQGFPRSVQTIQTEQGPTSLIRPELSESPSEPSDPRRPCPSRLSEASVRAVRPVRPVRAVRI